MTSSGAGSGLSRIADPLDRLLRDRAQARVLRAVGDHVAHRVDHDEHVEVDVGDEARDRHRRMRGEVVRADQPLLLRRDRDEQDRAPRARARVGEGARDLDQRRDPGRVVERTVVDRVAVDRRADPEVVEVRAVDDVLVAQPGVGAAQQADDVGARDVAQPRAPPDAGLAPAARRPAASRPHRRRTPARACAARPRTGSRPRGGGAAPSP